MYSNVRYSEEARNYKVISNGRAKRKEDMKYKLIQIVLGMLCFFVSAMEFVGNRMGLYDEGGAFLILIPIGLYMLFKKEV